MKTVVITGSTRGLGYEMAKQFLQKNYNVLICGTKSETVSNALEKLAQIKSSGKVLGKVCNVSLLEEVEKLAKYATEQFGSIDIWINNAGVNQSFAYFWEIPEEELDFLLKVDLKGTVNGTTVATKHMIKQNKGAIYNVEGMGSNDAFQPRFAIYGTAKRAVTYFTDAAAGEIKDKGLPLIIGKLSPGIMITDFLTSAKGKQNQTDLDEKTKKVYNILGDYPDIIAEFLVTEIEKNTKNGTRISWLTAPKAAFRFMTSGINKRNFF